MDKLQSGFQKNAFNYLGLSLITTGVFLLSSYFIVKNKKDEIQKCDECNIFKTDKHAEWYVIFNNINNLQALSIYHTVL